MKPGIHRREMGASRRARLRREAGARMIARLDAPPLPPWPDLREWENKMRSWPYQIKAVDALEMFLNLWWVGMVLSTDDLYGAMRRLGFPARKITEVLCQLVKEGFLVQKRKKLYAVVRLPMDALREELQAEQKRILAGYQLDEPLEGPRYASSTKE